MGKMLEFVFLRMNKVSRLLVKYSTCFIKVIDKITIFKKNFMEKNKKEKLIRYFYSFAFVWVYKSKQKKKTLLIPHKYNIYCQRRSLYTSHNNEEDLTTVKNHSLSLNH